MITGATLGPMRMDGLHLPRERDPRSNDGEEAPVPASAGPARNAAGPRYEARLHRSLASVAPVWRSLETAGTETAFQRLDWVEQMLEHLPGPAGAETFFVELRERVSGRPIMILPFALVRRYGVRVVTWLDFGVCDYAAPVLAADAALGEAACAEIWAEVCRALPGADLLHIEKIPSDMHGRANPLAALPGLRPTAFQAFGVPIDGDPETLLERICRRSTLRDLSKQRRRLERGGTVTFSEARTPEEIEDLFAAVAEQRRRRFGAMGRFDLMARPEVSSFYREAALAGGAVRIVGLAVDGEWIGAFYCLVHRGHFYGLLLTSTSEPQWQNASPGTQMVMESLKWARAQGLTYFDLSIGDLRYKHDFGVEARRLHEILQPLTLRGWLLARAMDCAEAAQSWLKDRPALHARLQGLRRKARRAGM